MFDINSRPHTIWQRFHDSNPFSFPSQSTSRLTIYSSVSNGMQWLNINFEHFGIFLIHPGPWTRQATVQPLNIEWLMWPDEPCTVNHSQKLMHEMLCNYMITNDPDKKVMEVHGRWYLMLIYDIVCWCDSRSMPEFGGFGGLGSRYQQGLISVPAQYSY